MICGKFNEIYTICNDCKWFDAIASRTTLENSVAIHFQTKAQYTE